MIETLIVSQILLGILVVGLAVTVFALARQVGLLHERIAPAGALAINQRVKAGDAAPEMTVADLDGREVAIGGEQAASRLLFFMSPDCPVCKTLFPILRSIARAEKDWLAVALVSDGGIEEDHRALSAKEGLEDFPYLLSEALGRAFGVAKLPYAVLIDGAGKVASMGLVNSREHLESLFEAKDHGVASLQDYVARRAAEGRDQQRIGA